MQDFMRASLNGKLLDGLSPKLENALTLSKPQPPVEGLARSAGEAATAVTVQQLIPTIAIAVMSAVFLFGFLPTVDPKDRALIFPLAIVVVIAVMTFAIVMVRRRARSARAVAQRALPGMPAGGTAIRADDTGLTLGSRTMPWSAFALTAVDLGQGQASPEGGRTITYIKAVELQSAAGPVLLIDDHITNSRALLDTVWRKLRATAP
jgi:hypothetical protein